MQACLVQHGEAKAEAEDPARPLTETPGLGHAWTERLAPRRCCPAGAHQPVPPEGLSR